jgi:hypothetical protein
VPNAVVMPEKQAHPQMALAYQEAMYEGQGEYAMSSLNAMKGGGAHRVGGVSGLPRHRPGLGAAGARHRILVGEEARTDGPRLTRPVAGRLEYDFIPRALSSAGQSGGLIIRWSLVQIQQGPQKPQKLTLGRGGCIRYPEYEIGPEGADF